MPPDTGNDMYVIESEAKHLPQGGGGRLFATAQSDNEKALVNVGFDGLNIKDYVKQKPRLGLLFHVRFNE